MFLHTFRQIDKQQAIPDRQRIVANLPLRAGRHDFPGAILAAYRADFRTAGVDFSLIAKILAGALIIVIPLLAAGMRYLIPEADIRLEMLFMTNMLVAALGIVVTVNGRTAAVGTNTIDWGALAGLVIILSAGLFTGLAYNKYTTRKTISKLK